MATYQELSTEFDALMSSNQMDLASKGDFSRAGELPDFSQAGIEEVVTKSLALADKIDAGGHIIDGIDQQIDLEVASSSLRANALELNAPVNGTPRHAILPNALGNFLMMTPIYFTRDPRDKGMIIKDLIARCNSLGAYLDGEASRLQLPVAAWANMEIDAGDSFGVFVASAISLAESTGYQNMPRLKSALSKAEDAVKVHVAKLREMPKRTDYSIGPDLTERLFRFRGIAKSPDEMFEQANGWLANALQRLEEMKKPLLAKYGLNSDATIYQLGKFLKERFACSPDQIIPTVNNFVARATEFAYAKGLVKPLENASSTVVETPSYLKPYVPMAVVLTHCSFAPGERKTVYFITTSTSGIELELNQLTLSDLSCHELTPGHQIQLTRATEHPSRIRGWIVTNDTVEGWTTRVAEEIMRDLGFSANPELHAEERYIQLLNQLRLPGRVFYLLAGYTGDRKYLANNLGVDVSDPDITTASVALYQTITGFAKPRAIGDVEMFPALGTYGAMYLMGNLAFHEMERKARASQGTRFKIPEFLESILREGNIPVAYLERALQAKGKI